MLRIVSMIMIISFHIIMHPVYSQLIDVQATSMIERRAFDQPIFFSKLLTLVFFLPFGKVGNACFLLITGYFMVGNEHIDLLRISKKLLSQFAFAIISLVVISFVFRLAFHEKYIGMISVTNLNFTSWFASYYLVIMLIAPFINHYIKSWEKDSIVHFSFHFLR